MKKDLIEIIILLIIFIILLWAFPAFSQINAAWNESEGATGYKLYWGIESRNYIESKTTNDTQIQVPLSRFERERTYFFTVTAFNTFDESAFSNEISLFLPTGIEDIGINFEECDKIQSYNILGKRVEFDRSKLPTGIYIHVCWLGDKVVWIKSEGLLK